MGCGGGCGAPLLRPRGCRSRTELPARAGLVLPHGPPAAGLLQNWHGCGVCVCVCVRVPPQCCAPAGGNGLSALLPPPTPSAAPPRALPSLCALPRGCSALHVRPALRCPPEVAVLAGLCIQEEPGVTPDPRAACCGAARTPTPHSVLLCASLPVPALICTVCSNLKITHPPRSPLPGGFWDGAATKHTSGCPGVFVCAAEPSRAANAAS